MWIVPGIAGAWLIRGDYKVSVLFLGAVFLMFWARYPVWLWARSRPRRFPPGTYASTLAIGLVGIVLAFVLILTDQRWGMLGFGALAAVIMAMHLVMTATGLDRTLGAEFLGIGGLGIVGPATYYIAGGPLDTDAALAWLLPAFFFGNSVFAVKLRVEGYVRIKRGVSAKSLRLLQVSYLAFMLAVLSVLAVVGVTTPWVVCAYLPVTVQVLWPVHNIGTAPRLGRLGLLWVTHSTLFTILLLLLV